MESESEEESESESEEERDEDEMAAGLLIRFICFFLHWFSFGFVRRHVVFTVSQLLWIGGFYKLLVDCSVLKFIWYL